MKPTLLTTLLLASGLALTARAVDHTDRGDDDRRNNQTSNSRREEHMDCSRSDRRRNRDDRHSRNSRRECDDPPVIIYSVPAYGYGYYPPYPLYAPYPPMPPGYYNGRFVPIPIPRRPVYILPGMR